ncbi:MAG TPA: CHAP domain-containing protein [Solirubrobacteraceae bacterium]|nr:CHAP domain-containing protein [Solirubrobacteraceae bacterium]
MSIESTLERVAALRQTLADPSALLTGVGATGGTAAPVPDVGSGAQPSFADALQSAAAPGTATAPGTGALAVGELTPTLAPTAAGSPLGARIVAIAESQLGRAEQPPGSNESPAIAQYRTATAGAAPGEPWCAYFASWVAAQAGAPIGVDGQGAGAVSQLWSWAQSSGRAIANGPGVVPQPGDLIVFGDQHVGIVRGVLPDGQIATIEGNYENKVAANVRSASEASGYVRMS